MMRRWALALLAPVLALLAMTRLPRADGLEILGWALLLVPVACAPLALRRAQPGWPLTGLVVGLLAILLLPPSRTALLSAMPAFVPPLATLAFLAILWPPVRARAPVTQGGTPARVRRWLPLLALVSVLLLLPSALLAVLPDRLARLQELQGSALPLLAAGLLVVPLLVGAWIRDALQLRADQEPNRIQEEAA